MTIADGITILVIIGALAFGLRENAAVRRDAKGVVTKRELAAIRARQIIVWQAVAIIALVAIVVRAFVA